MIKSAEWLERHFRRAFPSGACFEHEGDRCVCVSSSALRAGRPYRVARPVTVCLTQATFARLDLLDEQALSLAGQHLTSFVRSFLIDYKHDSDCASAFLIRIGDEILAS